ncbi:Eco57I restriction-modification methylase domain-containing protein [Clostridium thailandense]|uniref:Eco57I restriction-modification methylase domain-containing protein n=1 Tax=Clostridium thailandense TaxID=2794346 RepID=UPI00398A33A1
MYEEFFEKINELYNILLQPLDNFYKNLAVKNYKKMLKIDEKSSFSEEYCRLREGDKEKGIIYTPEEIALFILENIINSEEILNNPYLKIVDPACGCGNIIIPCFKYIKNIYLKNLDLINRKHNMKLTSDNLDKHIIYNNIYGFDIDEDAIKVLNIDLFNVSNNVYEKNFKVKDFLIDKIDEKYDVFIGNPPYIGHKSIDRDYSRILKEKYKGIYKDKGDISYCFFQSSIEKLTEKGKLSFITSRYFLESPSGEELRSLLMSKISIYKIVDFYGIRPFKKAGIDPVIIFLSKDLSKNEKIEVIKPREVKRKIKKSFYESIFLNKGEMRGCKKFFIDINDLDKGGWSLIEGSEKNIVKKIEEKSFDLLGKLCRTNQGIITGCDKAFVVDYETIVNENIEKDIIRPWIKNSYIHKNSITRENKYIIYSNLIKNLKSHPNAINYIGKYKEKLINRRECKKGLRLWYELQWGRTQETFEKEKIIFPYKSNSNRFALDKGSYFSADVYSLTLNNQDMFSYEYLLYILNSKLYEFYFKTFAKKLGEDLFEYYPNNLNKLRIPLIENLTDFKDESLLYKFFDLTEEEINIINNKE